MDSYTSIFMKKRSKKSKYSPGIHPNSQANLTYHEGRPRQFETEKKNRTISVTQKGWDGAKEVAKEQGFSSLSELIEYLGRKELKISGTVKTFPTCS